MPHCAQKSIARPLHIRKFHKASNDSDRVYLLKVKLSLCFILTKHHSMKAYCYFTLCALARNKSHDSSVGIALGYELDDRGSRIRFPAGTGNFSLHHLAQNGLGTHPASYQMANRGSFPEGKAAGAWSWPLAPSSAEVKEWVQPYLHSLLRFSGVVLS
jgi:hypothetical protein